jgi:hypothetical protein
MGGKKTWGMLAGGKPFGNRPKSKLNQQINDLIKNRPEYTIQDESFENKDLAENMAFGRDRASQIAEDNIMTSGADAIGQAQQVSGSTNALLDTLASINGNQSSQLRDLGVSEAQTQSQRMRDLYGANTALAEEKDKAWNFNVNEPYQNQIQALRDKKKFRQELAFKAIDTVGGLGASLIPGLGKKTPA